MVEVLGAILIIVSCGHDLGTMTDRGAPDRCRAGASGYIMAKRDAQLLDLYLEFGSNSAGAHKSPVRRLSQVACIGQEAARSWN